MPRLFQLILFLQLPSNKSITILLFFICSIFCINSWGKPQRVVSLNLCTDQILLMLLPPERILSVTHLAKKSEYSFYWQQAQPLHSNSGLAEEIIPLNPDLIITTPYSPGSAIKLLHELGYPVEVLDIPTSLNGVEDFVRRIASLTGESKKANALLENMQQKIHLIKTAQKNTTRPKALIYGPNGHTAGKKTLKNEILDIAGYDNLAADLGIDHYGHLNIEQLLHAQPDLIIIDDSTENQHSLAQQFINHPALATSFNKKQRIHIHANQWLCPGPMALAAIDKLVLVKAKENN